MGVGLERRAPDPIGRHAEGARNQEDEIGAVDSGDFAQWQSPDSSGLTDGLKVRVLPLEPFDAAPRGALLMAGLRHALRKLRTSLMAGRPTKFHRSCRFAFTYFA